MADERDVCVLIPTYNEAETIGDVVAGLRDEGLDNVLVVDGHSEDGTPEIAAEEGARVVSQSGEGRGSGKGQAVREALEEIEAEHVLMLDGDGTYLARDATTMLEPLESGTADHVIGNRFADMDAGAMSRLNRFGNRIINRAFALIHGRNLRDVLSGYRAFRHDSIDPDHLTSEGFGIETEMAVECTQRDVNTAVVPISYRARPDGSETNLRPFRDGGRIILTMYLRSKTNNPLFYFGSIGVVFNLIGMLLGAYVGVEWVTQRISHEVLAVLAAFAIVFGVQLLMFGVLSDLMVTLHREQLRRIEEK